MIYTFSEDKILIESELYKNITNMGMNIWTIFIFFIIFFIGSPIYCIIWMIIYNKYPQKLKGNSFFDNFEGTGFFILQMYILIFCMLFLLIFISKCVNYDRNTFKYKKVNLKKLEDINEDL